MKICYYIAFVYEKNIDYKTQNKIYKKSSGTSELVASVVDQLNSTPRDRTLPSRNSFQLFLHKVP